MDEYVSYPCKSALSAVKIFSAPLAVKYSFIQPLARRVHFPDVIRTKNAEKSNAFDPQNNADSRRLNVKSASGICVNLRESADNNFFVAVFAP